MLPERILSLIFNDSKTFKSPNDDGTVPESLLLSSSRTLNEDNWPHEGGSVRDSLFSLRIITESNDN